MIIQRTFNIGDYLTTDRAWVVSQQFLLPLGDTSDESEVVVEFRDGKRVTAKTVAEPPVVG